MSENQSLQSQSDSQPNRPLAANHSAEDETSQESSAVSERTPNRESTGEESANRENELLSLIRDLNECNDALLAQVTKLEDDLQSAEANARAEVEKAAAAVQLAQEKMSRQVSVEQASAQQVSQTAQQQVARLVGQLDAAEQTLSRQVLVNESLKTELTEAEERIAQLEKECTLMGQRHAAEMQARVQAENKSRDLRSRLQRQQRYTLQFKAALEKSLSVGASSAANAALKAQPVPFNQSTHPSAAVSMPRSQRIMPWAAASNTTAFQGIDPHLEALIRRGSRPLSSASTPTPSSLQERIQKPSTSIPNSIPKNSQTANASAKPSSSEAASSELVSPEAEAELWQDLERVMTNEAEVKEAGVKKLEKVSEAIATEAVEPEAAAPKATETIVVEASVKPFFEDRDANDEAVDARAADTGAIAEKRSPRLNWLAKSQQTHPQQTPVTAEDTAEDAAEDTAEDAAEDIKRAAEAARQASLNNTALSEALTKAKQRSRLDAAESNRAVFTEPSPWRRSSEPPTKPAADKPIADEPAADKPIAEPARQPSLLGSAAVAAASTDYLPALDDGSASKVSPVAKPLQAHKKVSSLASVKLPTFPSAKSASFKR